MGAWSHRILDDDVAAEVVATYVERLYEGNSAEAATNQVVEEFGHVDVDEHSVFWLSLATVQFDYGRLVESVKRKALKIIASGEDLAKWNGDKKRARTLAALERKLLGPSKPLKKLVRRPPKLREGDVFRLPLGDGRFGFGRVLTQVERAFYTFTSSEKRPPLAAILASEILFVVGSTDDGFARRKWFVIGHSPIEESLREPIYFYHQAVGADRCTVFDIWDLEQLSEKPPNECKELEQWGAWSADHCRDRVLAALAGKECKWIPRGR